MHDQFVSQRLSAAGSVSCRRKEVADKDASSLASTDSRTSVGVGGKTDSQRTRLSGSPSPTTWT